MLLRKLFWSVLASVPLVTSFEINELLSGKLIDSLPETMQEMARDIKELLRQYPSLHTDCSQTWGPLELEQFTQIYFPKLKALMVAAMENIDCFRTMRDGAAELPWPRDLTNALEYLTYKPSDISVTDPALASKLAVADRNLSSLGRILRTFAEKITPADFTEKQWGIEASTLTHRVDLELMVELAKELGNGMNKRRPAAHSLEQELGPDSKDDLGVESVLSDFTEALGPLFASLRPAARELLDFKCKGSWVCKGTLPWESLLRLRLASLQLGNAFDHFRARLLAETILLRLEVTKLRRDTRRSTLEFCEKNPLTTLSKSTGNIRQEVEKISNGVKTFVENQTNLEIGQLTHTMAESLILGLKPRYILLCFDFKALDHSLRVLNFGTERRSKLEPEAEQGIRSAYEVLRQLVESYDTLLRAIKEREDRDSLLLTLFRSTDAEKVLNRAKGAMDYAEEALGQQLGDMRYDWKQFSLRYCFPHPQTAAENTNIRAVEKKEEREAPENSLLQKRGRGGPDEAEDGKPGAKRAKRGASPDGDSDDQE